MSDRPAAWALAAVAVALVLVPAAATAQVGPEQSARQLKPAAGVEATLWAAEPMVKNPTNIDVDSRGRVWVAEGLNYRYTHDNKSFSRGLGLKKFEEADAIKILEDTDGDGKADKMTVFADRIFPVPMGLAVEERYAPDGKYQGCKVYVGNSPDLLVLEDTDGDDKADKRYPLLTGFGGIDSDHGVHGMILAPDGKLYFTHGDGCCSFEQDHSHRPRNFDVTDKGGRHVRSDQLANTLRVNRDGTQFETLADRQRNNYEASLTSFGEVFVSDNDDDGNRGCRVLWIMDGGHYGYKTPGSPRHWGEDVPGNVPKLVGTGNGSPCGVMVYEGDYLPAEYHGAVFEAEAGTRQVNAFPIVRHGAAFRTEAGVLLASDDPWFRPVDATAAPDGSVFVADWYDAGVGGHKFSDQTTGRIYRVATKGKKAETPRADFSTVHGLIRALRSPAVATRDAARRGLIARAAVNRAEVETALVNLFSTAAPHERARALWVLHAVAGDEAAKKALKDADPRIREQAVRILGRDDAANGEVEYAKPEAKVPPPASKHLGALLPMADDPDAGVRRELILALRNLPTDQVGDALLTLTKAWDGRDRWYLEALGLALDRRESDYILKLSDGTLYGDLGLPDSGRATGLALPPYFPVDRNESYIAIGAKELPASPLSKTLGLAWRLHRAEALPLVGRIAPELTSPELQRAADDALNQMPGPETAVLLADLAMKSGDPARRIELMETIAGRLSLAWRDARRRRAVAWLAESSLRDPGLRRAAIALAAATEDPRHAPTLFAIARDEKVPEDLRAAAVEAAVGLGDREAQVFLNELIERTRGRGSNTAAEAAVRALPRVGKSGDRLLALIGAGDVPLGVRREAVRTFARLKDGAIRLLMLARSGDLPDPLKIEATTALATHPDKEIRDTAAMILPLPKTRGGRPLPSFAAMVEKPGRADRGRDIFFRQMPTLDGQRHAEVTFCGGCHRVQGRGRWVGPDLSTIGTKYGRDELLRSVLNPNAAIGYNFRTLAVALDDGRVFTGLPVEDTPDRLVLKTLEGERIVIRPGQVEGRKALEVSLMPEGLAESMSDQDLADLLSFLSTLRQPVSIIGQYQAIGPVSEPAGAAALDPSAPVDLTATLRGPEGQALAWRRLDANAEGLVEPSGAAADPSRAVYLYAPVVSPIAQQARLVIESKGEVKAWLGGRPVPLPSPADDATRAVTVDLPQGRADLLLRLAGGAGAAVVTTFVSDAPLAFRTDEARVSSR